MAIRLKYLLFGALAMISFPAPGSALDSETSDGPSPCAPQTFSGAGYIVCTVGPGADLRLFWKDEAALPFRSFSKLDDAVRAKGKTLVFAMNAGMYSDDFVPVGLYVENGDEQVPVNRREMTGKPASIPNFYKRPNGVFFVDQDGAHILTTDDYLKRVSEPGHRAPRFATQSGPMLVIGGKLHPALIAGSSDRTRRSGVGLCKDGNLRFAISEDDVNFYDFALLFRDGLSCDNALFLDGGHGTGLFDPKTRRADWSWHGGYGPIFGLVK